MNWSKSFFLLEMAIRIQNPTKFLDPERNRIRIHNLNCRFGLLIFTTFVAYKTKIIFTVSFMLKKIAKICNPNPNFPEISRIHNPWKIRVFWTDFYKNPTKKFDGLPSLNSHSDIHPITIKKELINNYVSICLFSTGQSVSKKSIKGRKTRRGLAYEYQFTIIKEEKKRQQQKGS